MSEKIGEKEVRHGGRTIERKVPCQKPYAILKGLVWTKRGHLPLFGYPKAIGI